MRHFDLAKLGVSLQVIREKNHANVQCSSFLRNDVSNNSHQGILRLIARLPILTVVGPPMMQVCLKIVIGYRTPFPSMVNHHFLHWNSYKQGCKSPIFWHTHLPISHCLYSYIFIIFNCFASIPTDNNNIFPHWSYGGFLYNGATHGYRWMVHWKKSHKKIIYPLASHPHCPACARSVVSPCATFSPRTASVVGAQSARRWWGDDVPSVTHEWSHRFPLGFMVIL